MPVSSVELLRSGLGLKLAHVRQATSSYFRDRAEQATRRATSYAIAAGLFAVAGVFAVGTLMIGLIALFRWVQLNYGEFQAFGAVAGAMIQFALLSTAFAMLTLKRKTKSFPRLASRLRVAVASPPIPDGTVQRAATEAVSRAGNRVRRKMTPATTGLLLGTLALSGYAIARRLGNVSTGEGVAGLPRGRTPNC
jgi:hypothetical protein